MRSDGNIIPTENPWKIVRVTLVQCVIVARRLAGMVFACKWATADVYPDAFICTLVSIATLGEGQPRLCK